jgi:hypothetical protein
VSSQDRFLRAGGHRGGHRLHAWSRRSRTASAVWPTCLAVSCKLCLAVLFCRSVVDTTRYCPDAVLRHPLLRLRPCAHMLLNSRTPYALRRFASTVRRRTRPGRPSHTASSSASPVPACTARWACTSASSGACDAAHIRAWQTCVSRLERGVGRHIETQLRHCEPSRCRTERWAQLLQVHDAGHMDRRSAEGTIAHRPSAHWLRHSCRFGCIVAFLVERASCACRR